MTNHFMKISIGIWLAISIGILPGCSQDGDLQEKAETCIRLFPPLDTVITSHTAFTKTNYPKRIESFMMDTIQQGDIVMLGNSITQQGGFWSDRFDIPNVKNRGIAGDNTSGVLARLDEIVCRQPSKVFLMIGTNDLWLSDAPEMIVDHIQAIIDEIKRSASTEVYVQTIMPMAAGHEMTARIDEVNELLRNNEPAGALLIDTFKEMADEHGSLPANYTTDGVHLTQAGYEKWASFLKPYVTHE